MTNSALHAIAQRAYVKCVITFQQTKLVPFRTKYRVIASVAWQSPGRVTLLIIWWFLLNCQKDTLAKYMTDCDIFFGII